MDENIKLVNPEMNSAIILIDSDFDIGELRKTIKDNSILIVTFDYESHKTLSENDISHMLSDDYLKEGDLELIQEKSFIFSKWSNEPDIAKFLDYKGVNTGTLFFEEFHYMLIPFLKKFFEFTKIFVQYPKTKFVCSPNIFEIAKTFTDSISLLGERPLKSQKFYNDSINVNFRIGKGFVAVGIPRSYYLKMKKISEIIIRSLFGLKKRVPSSGKFTLLVEFDTIKYRKFFSLLPSKLLNVVVFDRRRPAIWNQKSFSIIKNSKCSIATYYDLADSELEPNVDKEFSQFFSKVNLLIDNNKFFESFFSINGFSFWGSLKENFKKLCQQKMKDAIREVELTARLFEKLKPNSVLVWSEIGFNEQIVIKFANKFGIPVILIQHGGIAWDTPQACEFNKFAGIFPLQSNKFIAWGEILKKCAIDCGVQQEKIKVLGSPVLDDAFQLVNYGKNFKQDYILFATSSPVNNFVYDSLIKTRENYEQAIIKVCETALKLNKKLIIKLHPSAAELDISDLVKRIDPRITVIKSGNIFSLIESCEALVVTDVSSVILEAQMFGKPVISLSIKDYRFGEPEVFRSKSCMRTTIDGFEDSLNSVLNKPDLRKQIIENGYRFVEKSLSNRGNATEALIEYLKQL